MQSRAHIISVNYDGADADEVNIESAAGEVLLTHGGEKCLSVGAHGTEEETHWVITNKDGVTS